MKNKNLTKGFTVVELLISIAILVGVSWTASIFERDVFSLNGTLQDSLNAQLDGRNLVKTMVAELRKTTESSVGSYPVDTAATSSIAFYSDIDNDGLIEKVRYFLNGNVIKKGVIKPTGSPLTYNPANETLSTLVNSVVSSSTLPIFQYYPETYTGTSSPLSIPVDVSQVRLVKITVIIDKNPNRSPTQIIETSNATLRNLKDNL